MATMDVTAAVNQMATAAAAAAATEPFRPKLLNTVREKEKA